MPKQRSNDREKFLKKTQEVLYAKEFKRANRVYDQFSQQKGRS
ncbi:YfhE family protein [Oceanobacillus jeddahense]|uniref:YfhE family protein n=1 Tax=Oceanobacillus jeddahense TaxID=1462527 RepID=A0ABY5JX71_9BACI|nr:YfhE family protein [Oceanobacillus jeddahense]UUI04032.1 YfhE family protein [Oceanobacillus jeddahense]